MSRRIACNREVVDGKVGRAPATEDRCRDDVCVGALKSEEGRLNEGSLKRRKGLGGSGGEADRDSDVRSAQEDRIEAESRDRLVEGNRQRIQAQGCAKRVVVTSTALEERVGRGFTEGIEDEEERGRTDRRGIGHTFLN